MLKELDGAVGLSEKLVSHETACFHHVKWREVFRILLDVGSHKQAGSYIVLSGLRSAALGRETPLR